MGRWAKAAEGIGIAPVDEGGGYDLECNCPEITMPDLTWKELDRRIDEIRKRLDECEGLKYIFLADPGGVRKSSWLDGINLVHAVSCSPSHPCARHVRVSPDEKLSGPTELVESCIAELSALDIGCTVVWWPSGESHALFFSTWRLEGEGGALAELAQYLREDVYTEEFDLGAYYED